jgi:hypothetical protein
MTMIDADLLAECREFARIVAPELTALNVVDVEILAGLPVRGCCLGFSGSPALKDNVVAERIPDYEGGAIICLDFGGIEAAANPGCFRQCVNAVMGHETGHVVPKQEPFDILPATPLIRAYEIERLRTDLQGPMLDGPADVSHGAAFLRRCIHIYVRACAAGYDIPLSSMLGYASEWHSPPQYYLPYCLKEAMAMRHATFAEIEATDPPPGLVERWAADLELYRMRQSHHA